MKVVEYWINGKDEVAKAKASQPTGWYLTIAETATSRGTTGMRVRRSLAGDKVGALGVGQGNTVVLTDPVDRGLLDERIARRSLWYD